MSDLIIEALTKPELLEDLTLAQWDLLIRQARRANLLSRLSRFLQDLATFSPVIPAPAKNHLFSGAALASRQEIAIRREVEEIRRALLDAQVPLVLLKGAAYVMAGLPTAQGRLFGDVDIIVPKALVGEAEAGLMLHGWNTTQHTAYDDKYYRKWMHEIPPMQHIRRGTIIDVHHTILPETARIKTNASKLLEAIVPVADGVYVLAPADMLLHSATHLFHEGELDNGLRDLFDLDSLLRYFGAQAGFWEALVPRAIDVGLTRPLYYALRYTRTMLATPIPDAVLQAAEVGSPAPTIRSLMDFCYLHALRPVHASCSDTWTTLARKLLYLRSHWIRMPFPLLLVHLTRKAFFTPEIEDPEGPAAMAAKAKKERQEATR